MADDLKRVVELGRTPIGDGDGREYELAALTLIRDHGQALVEALVDAERYRMIRTLAIGEPHEFHRVENAAFVSTHGCGHNFDFNIDAMIEAARSKTVDGGGV